MRSNGCFGRLEDRGDPGVLSRQTAAAREAYLRGDFVAVLELLESGPPQAAYGGS
jgi:hypothetical protein